MVVARRLLVFVTILAVGAFACGSGEATESLSIAHVHGLGVAGDVLFVATQTGLFVRDEGEWSQRSEDTADHMGFTLVSEDLMFRSGHPPEGGNLGVQRSTDGGRTGETVSTVLEQPVDFHAMAGSGDPLTIYGWAQLLFRSVGDPRQWEPAEADGLTDPVGALAVSETDGAVYASTPQGLARSSDRGATWERASDRRVFAVAVGADGSVLYASSIEAPLVLRSLDGGGTWQEMGDGLEASQLVVALATSPNGRTVAAADADGRIWTSEDEGAGWSEVATP